MSRAGKGKKVSSFFEKKEAKKLLLIWLRFAARLGSLRSEGFFADRFSMDCFAALAVTWGWALPRAEKSFFGSFFSKKELLVSLLLLLATSARADDALIARGKALATAGDCVACHTAPGGKDFAGGLGLETPFGVVRVANITPDKVSGIGTWTADDFARAMREGLRPDGGHLYPAFPYPFYAKVTREDADAIFAYLQSLPAVSNRVDRGTLPYPFRIRALMMGWNLLFLDEGVFRPDPQRSAAFNRGAYLVEGLGHCGACHTPLNRLGANRGSMAFEAGRVGAWTAPNITADARLGVGGWSVEEIVSYLKTGANATNVASGPMAEVVMKSTSQMPVEDLRAMAVYLKERGAPAPAPVPVARAAEDAVGRAIFVDTCGACHGRDGAGVSGIFPKLAGNPVVVQADPASLVRVVLAGAQAAATAEAPTGPAMPAFGYRLDDAQVAAVLTYVRNAWGNAAPVVSAEEVRAGRSQ
jgi:mono/diheme cytochrome c family protein